MIHLAIPAMDERELPDRLLNLNRQSLLPKMVCVCVNQPQAYYTDGLAQHRQVCQCNQEVYRQLQQMNAEGRFAFHLVLIDRFSPQNAWSGKRFGVGWARKTAMDFIAREAGVDVETDLLVCADADTVYPENYLQDIQTQFDRFPEAVALANPYYHPLSNGDVPLDEEQQKAMLHYEVYMRSYALNMCLSGHPYAFTAVGSSMACRMRDYLKIGGISPFKSGEDFYFLQKLAKTGPVIVDSPSVSNPSARLSARVFFGTGPALRKGLENRWESYPFYPKELFDRMRQAYAALPELFATQTPTKALDFWTEAFGKEWWVRILQNSGGREQQFVRACKEKFDALRSLQFLKAHYRQDNVCDWRNLSQLCMDLSARFLKNGQIEYLCGPKNINSLEELSLQDWKQLRDYLFACERQWQETHPVLHPF